MITSAENHGWPGDVPVNNFELAGLPAPFRHPNREDCGD
jgi:hypothetical protein